MSQSISLRRLYRHETNLRRKAICILRFRVYSVHVKRRIGCDAFCEVFKKGPKDGLCDCMRQMVYIFRAVFVIQRCHHYCLPTVENKVEAALVGERWPLQMSVSYIILG